MSAFSYRRTTFYREHFSSLGWMKNVSSLMAVYVALSSAFLFSVCPQTANAAGYGINENSASYMGTSFAGRASNPIDASIAANNPAGISFVEDSTVSVGTAVIMKGGEFEGKHTLPPDNVIAQGKTEDFQVTTPVPFGHFVMPINDRLSFGISGYGPFGIELDYKDDWAGRYFGDKTHVKVINLQGTLSYQLAEDFSVGFGLVGSYVTGELTQLTSPVDIPGVADTSAKIKGDDKTMAWNIGALWQVTPVTNLGLVYHSRLDFSLKGDFELDSPATKLDASLDIIMPERAALSITHQLGQRWTLLADATWTRWSRFKEFHVKTSDPGISSYIPMHWKDVWAFSLGVSCQLSGQWLLRAGYMLDQSPVDDDNRTVRSPDADRNWFTLGANWQATRNLSIDLSYAFVDLKKGGISESKHNVPGTGDDVVSSYGKLTGDYSNSSHIVAAQLNYRF